MSSKDQTPDTDELERAAGQIEAPLASLVGDYEEPQSGSAAQAAGIFLLPNLFTSGALFCGFYSIIAGMQGDDRRYLMANAGVKHFAGFDGAANGGDAIIIPPSSGGGSGTVPNGSYLVGSHRMVCRNRWHRNSEPSRKETSCSPVATT